MGRGYRDLVVWQKARKLTVEIYEVTEQFPQSEIYGLTSQMRRSAVSIASNIAEGSKRGSKKDFKHFLTIALGSSAELETQIDITKSLPFGKKLEYAKADSYLIECMKMLTKLIQSTTKDY